MSSARQIQSFMEVASSERNHAHDAPTASIRELHLRLAASYELLAESDESAEAHRPEVVYPSAKKAWQRPTLQSTKLSPAEMALALRSPDSFRQLAKELKLAGRL